MKLSINNSQLNQGINEAQKLIEDFKSSSDTGQKPDEEVPLFFISRRDEGSLTFWGDEIKQYKRCLNTLHTALKGKGEERWSLRAIEKLLQDSIFFSLDIHEKSSEPFEVRLGIALNTLKSTLTAPFVTGEFYFRVVGLDVRNTCAKVGKVKFFPGDEENATQLYERVNQIINAGAEEPETKELLNKADREKFSSFFEGAIACVSASAGDIEASRRLALKELQVTLDVINFYVLMMHDSDFGVRVYLPGDYGHERTLILTFMEDETVSLQYSSRGALTDFVLASIDQGRIVRSGLSRLNQILFNSTCNEFEERILVAACIAGKAVATTRREDAFLLYAIALESILVGGKETTDLTYKLSTRCAHLLGKNLENKKRIKKEISNLYGIRSAIVHRGDNEFTDLDFSTIQRYVRNVFVVLLKNKDFESFTKKDELTQWLEERVLS